MRTLITAAVIGIGIVLGGCIPSIHPLYTEQDLVEDQSLLGQWAGTEGDTWTFTKAGEKEYSLAYKDGDGKTGDFLARLVKVGEHRYLDLYPAEPDIEASDFYKLHLLRAHTFLRVKLTQSSLEMSTLKPDWVRDHLAANNDALRHEKIEDGILFTAQPKELQAFVTKVASTVDAWENMDPLKRPAAKPKE
jgi:hypothetical protein